MTDVIETRLNGVPYSATSCSFNIGFAPFVGITDFNYEQKRERQTVYGARKDGTPLGITSGQYSVSGSITMLRSTYQRLCEVLTTFGAGSYGDAIFPIIATYSEYQASLAGVLPITIDIQGCRITGEKDDFKSGSEALLTQVDFVGMQMSRNGLRLYSVVNGLGL